MAEVLHSNYDIYVERLSDPGTAPVVGHLFAVDVGNALSTEVAATLDTLEAKADPLCRKGARFRFC